jgi:hypothetical protein
LGENNGKEDMSKTNKKITTIVGHTIAGILIALVPAGFILTDFIRKYIPAYSPTLHLGITLYAFILFYSLITRMKTFFNFTLITLFILSVPIGFVYTDAIKHYMPLYSPITHLSATVFFSGLVYTLITRSVIVLSITIASTIAIPHLITLFNFHQFHQEILIMLHH